MPRVEQHVSELLILAGEKRAQAQAAVSQRPAKPARIRAAGRELDDAILLAEDVADLTQDLRVLQALTDLRYQRKLLADHLARIEAARLRPSLWDTPWPWAALVLIVVPVASLFA